MANESCEHQIDALLLTFDPGKLALEMLRNRSLCPALRLGVLQFLKAFNAEFELADRRRKLPYLV